jgi:formylglycine-generating enzyme required for sulfatase activity
MIGAFSFSGCGGGGAGNGGGTLPLTDTEAVTTDATALDESDITFTGSDTPSHVTGDYTLPTGGSNGTSITWAEKTDTENIVTLSGDGNATATVVWPESAGFGPYMVELTATIAKGDETTTKDIAITVYPSATTKISTIADGVTFKMVLVPGGKTFPTGTSDNGTATVANAYWIGETEVTYELWKKVYDWATTDVSDGKRADGGDLYYFANAGTMGDGSGDTNQHPVTTVNWRDCMVWCNAMTEWYNYRKETNFECVYTHSNVIIRDSRDTNATICDNAVVNTITKGFRLLTSNESQLAARWRGTDSTNVVTGLKGDVDFDAMTIKWTKGNSASGATADYLNETATGIVSVFLSNSSSSTAVVKSKDANTLGLHDMSGNVWEWCFDLSGTSRIRRGGAWNHSAGFHQVGFLSATNPQEENNSIGLRFARTQ